MPAVTLLAPPGPLSCPTSPSFLKPAPDAPSMLLQTPRAILGADVGNLGQKVVCPTGQSKYGVQYI